MEKIKMLELVKESKLSFYQIAKKMDKNPRSYADVLRRKITGEMPIKVEELGLLIKVLSTDKTMDDFEYKINSVNL